MAQRKETPTPPLSPENLTREQCDIGSFEIQTHTAGIATFELR